MPASDASGASTLIEANPFDVLGRRVQDCADNLDSNDPDSISKLQGETARLVERYVAFMSHYAFWAQSVRPVTTRKLMHAHATAFYNAAAIFVAAAAATVVTVYATFDTASSVAPSTAASGPT